MTSKEIKATLKDMAKTFSEFKLIEFEKATVLYLTDKYSITLTDYDLLIGINLIPDSNKFSNAVRYELDTIEEIIFNLLDMGGDRYFVINGKGYRHSLLIK